MCSRFNLYGKPPKIQPVQTRTGQTSCSNGSAARFRPTAVVLTRSNEFSKCSGKVPITASTEA
jgi:hypothetical protein